MCTCVKKRPRQFSAKRRRCFEETDNINNNNGGKRRKIYGRLRVDGRNKNNTCDLQHRRRKRRRN